MHNLLDSNEQMVSLVRQIRNNTHTYSIIIHAIRNLSIPTRDHYSHLYNRHLLLLASGEVKQAQLSHFKSV